MIAEDAIAKIIEEYLSKHPNLSISSLANKTGYCRRGIQRLQSKVYDKNRIDILSLRNFLSYLAGESITDEIISSDHQLNENLNKNVSYIRTLIMNKEEHVLKHDYNDDDETLCIFLASGYKGVSIERIQSILGDVGVEILKNLVKQNRLSEVNGRYILMEENSKGESSIILDRKKSKNAARIFTKYYKPQNSGKGINFIGIHHQNLNRKFCNEAQQKLQEFHNWFHENSKKEENRGDIPAFYSLILDSFILINDEGNEK